jgi:hypothetical protein
MKLIHVIATKTYDSIVAFDTIVPVVPVVALLMSSPVLRHKERLQDFSELQKVYLPNPVLS